MRQITVTKAKVKDGKLEVEFEETLKDGEISKISQSCTADVHPDMKTAFAGLNKHLASLCEQWTPSGELAIGQVNCKGFSLRGEDEKAGVVLSGTRTVANNRQFAINSPFLVWERDGEVYPDMGELETVIENCTDEVKQYLLNDKHAIEPQGKLAFPDEDNNLTDVSRMKQITDHAAIIIAQQAGGDASMKWLDSNARNGNLIRHIKTTDPEIFVDCFNLDDSQNEILEAMDKVNLIGKDFFDFKGRNRYDRVVAYPPMEAGLDVDHIQHMHYCLKSKGRMVALVSRETMSGTSNKQKKFQEWLQTVGAIISPISNAAYDEKGNEIGCALIIIDKK